jgi:citrate synthase
MATWRRRAETARAPVHVKLLMADQGRQVASTSNAALLVTRTTSDPSDAIV